MSHDPTVLILFHSGARQNFPGARPDFIRFGSDEASLLYLPGSFEPGFFLPILATIFGHCIYGRCIITIINLGKACHRYGFSLVELSIVLVILGLLVGGIMGGSHLIRAAKIRNVLEQFQSFTVAIQAFNCDMINATAFWGRECQQRPVDLDADYLLSESSQVCTPLFVRLF